MFTAERQSRFIFLIAFVHRDTIMSPSGRFLGEWHGQDVIPIETQLFVADMNTGGPWPMSADHETLAGAARGNAPTGL